MLHLDKPGEAKNTKLLLFAQPTIFLDSNSELKDLLKGWKDSLKENLDFVYSFFSGGFSIDPNNVEPTANSTEDKEVQIFESLYNPFEESFPFVRKSLEAMGATGLQPRE